MEWLLILFALVIFLGWVILPLLLCVVEVLRLAIILVVGWVWHYLVPRPYS